MMATEFHALKSWKSSRSCVQRNKS